MLFERLLVYSGDMFYETDLSGKIIKVSGSFENILGFRAEELIGKTIESLYKSPARRVSVEESLIKGGEKTDFSVVLITAKRTEVAVDETVFVIKDSEGRACGFEGIIRTSKNDDKDCTAKLENVLNSLPSAVSWKDKGLRYIGCSKNFLDIAGFHNVSDIYLKKDEQLFTESRLTRFAKGDKEIARGRSSGFNYVEIVCVQPTGEFRWFDITKSAIKDENGKFIGIVSVHEDITTWVNAELGIQNRLWFEQQIMEISAGFINLSTNEIDAGINNALEKISYFVEAERSCVFYINEETQKATVTHEWEASNIPKLMDDMYSFSLISMENLAKKLLLKEVINFSISENYDRFSLKEQEYIKYSNIKSLIIIPMVKSGHTVGFVTFSSFSKERDWNDDIVSLLTIVSEIFMNVLDRKNMQDELMELYSRMEDRVRCEVEKNIEQKKLLTQQSKLAAMGEMLGNIAHQWRQPLNALNLSFFELKYIQKSGGLTNERMNEILNRVSVLIQQMSSTVDDFRNFFHENKEQKLFSLRECVEKALYIVHPFLDQHKIKTEMECDEELAVSGYPSELAQVFINIFNNARDAFIENSILVPFIKVRIFFESGKAVIEIADNAGGIKEDIIERVFEPYFTTKHEGKGMGIGLYMSKMIVEHSMSGRLLVRNCGDGTCFRIELPHR